MIGLIMILGLINLMINIYSDITNRQNEPTTP
jgi:hypothetical protein